MKYKSIVLSVFFAFLCLLFLYGLRISLFQEGDRGFDQLWKTADSLRDAGQPRAAAEIAEKILQKGIREKQDPQWLRAHLYRLGMWAQFEEDLDEQAIRATEQLIGVAEEPARQILFSILAGQYTSYLNRNEWKLRGRTYIEGFRDSDFRNWDARTMRDTIAQLFLASIENPGKLSTLPMQEYEGLLIRDTLSGPLRPSMLDFLAYRAIDYFSVEEGLPGSESNIFRVDDPGYFEENESFLRIRFDRSPRVGNLKTALEIFQKLEQMHNENQQKAPLIHASFQRLNFVYQNSVLSDKDSLYAAALDRLSNRYHSYPYSTSVTFQLAQWYSERRYPGKAFEICQLAVERHPLSEGAVNCRILMEQLKEPSLSFSQDPYTPPGQAQLLQISYRNLERIYARVYKIHYGWKDTYNRVDAESRMDKILAMRPVLQFDPPLKNPGDLLDHTSEIMVPGLPSGYYAAIVSSGERFDRKQDELCLGFFQITGLNAAAQNQNGGGNSLLVADRQSGEPLQDAQVKLYGRQYNPSSRRWVSVEIERSRTGNDGRALFQGERPTHTGNFSYLISYKGDTIEYGNVNFYPRTSSKPTLQKNLHLFTDRMIYRPGQTVYYKGILIQTLGKRQELLTAETCTVQLRDANGKEVAVASHKSGVYGSFSGSFVLPSSGLSGSFSLTSPYGSHWFSVEEYKRPTFSVVMEEPSQAYRLNEEVMITGEAKAFAGYPVGGAKAAYRVVRQTRFVNFWNFWPGNRNTSETEISMGEVVTDAMGRFEIRFKALPDPAIPVGAKPYFFYRISVTVSDANGETRNGSAGLSVGYQSLLLYAGVPEKVNKAEPGTFVLRATNLSGKPQHVPVQVAVFRLIQPEGVFLERTLPVPEFSEIQEAEFRKAFSGIPYQNENQFSKWQKGEQMMKRNMDTSRDSVWAPDNMRSWESGVYKVEITTMDPYGFPVLGEEFFTLFAANESRLPYRTSQWFVPLNDECEPGQAASFLIGSCEPDVRILIQTVMPDSMVDERWILVSGSQKLVEIPVLEKYRGDVAVNFLYFKNNRTYSFQSIVKVPHTPRKLEVELETFRKTLEPGKQETWTVRVKDYLHKSIKAEVLASMYDASLDAFRPNHWSLETGFRNYSFPAWNGLPNEGSYPYCLSPWRDPKAYVSHSYDRLNWFGYPAEVGWFGDAEVYTMARGGRTPMVSRAMVAEEDLEETQKPGKASLNNTGNEEPQSPQTEGPLVPRTQFNETAFFVPHLETRSDSGTSWLFRVPDALTGWKLQILAHTNDLRTAYHTERVVTQKNVMIVPNAPRFLRVGDTLVFPARIVNLTNMEMEVSTSLKFSDPSTGEEVGLFAEPGNGQQTLKIPARDTKTVEWVLDIRCRPGVLAYHLEAGAGSHTDAMEDMIPVLTNQVWLTDTYPMFFPASTKKAFVMDYNPRAFSDPDARLTFEFTGNAAWYAAQALPDIAMPRWESADALFRAFYARTLSAYILKMNPEFRKIFESWQRFTPSALQSNLEKNQDMKAVLLDETPWVREAESEGSRKRNLGKYFDEGQMADAQTENLAKLMKLQLSNGGFSWFDGMPDSRYITQEILTGLGRLLQRESIKPETFTGLGESISKALVYLDERMFEEYQKIQAIQDKDRKFIPHLSTLDIQYLYMRSYFEKIQPVNDYHRKALDYYYQLASAQWQKQEPGQQAMLAIAFYESGRIDLSVNIVKSLKDRAMQSEIKGIYWAANRSRGGGEVPLESQAILIEAFLRTGQESGWVEKMKQWLLVQKRTQSWDTPRATADAVYALLLSGQPLLKENKPLEITLGGKEFGPDIRSAEFTEEGSGYFRRTLSAGSFTTGMESLEVFNPNATLAWGGIYLQYFEDMDQVKTMEGGLHIGKKVFLQRNTAHGPVLLAPGAGIRPETGDVIVVRLTLESDLDLEYVHIKDHRASGLEPDDVHSGYRWQDGAGYYQSTCDVATHFFFEYLPRGRRVLEYKLKVFQKGSYTSGFATLQCLYAPEFSARSEGIRMKTE